MSSALAVGRESADSPAPSRTDFRELLDRVLADVDADEKVGAMLRAADIRLRLRFPDLDMTLNVAASDEPGHHLRWAFSDGGEWPPRLELEMASEVANRYLQGKESLAVAIARGRVKVRGESRIALLYVPAISLVCDPYRRVVASDFPHLAIA